MKKIPTKSEVVFSGAILTLYFCVSGVGNFLQSAILDKHTYAVDPQGYLQSIAIILIFISCTILLITDAALRIISVRSKIAFTILAVYGIVRIGMMFLHARFLINALLSAIFLTTYSAVMLFFILNKKN